MAAPTFVSAGSIASDLSGSASFAPTPPAHIADDILLVAAHNAGGAVMSTSTSGWTQIATVAGTDDFAWFWARAIDSSTTGPTIEAASTDCFAICYVIRGCITTGDPFEDATTVSGGGANTTPDTATITTTGTDRLVICSIVHDDDTTWSSGYPPSGWTDESDVGSATGTDTGFSLISRTQASPGTITGTQVGVLSASELWGTLTLAFIPPSIVGTVPGIRTLGLTGVGA